MQAEAGAEFLQCFRVFGELGEEFHFDCAEQGLRSPEAETHLHDVVHLWFIHYSAILLNFSRGPEIQLWTGRAFRSYARWEKRVDEFLFAVARVSRLRAMAHSCRDKTAP